MEGSPVQHRQRNGHSREDDEGVPMDPCPGDAAAEGREEQFMR